MFHQKYMVLHLFDLYLYFSYLSNYFACRIETLRRHIPHSGPEGIDELSRIAARFEEKTFSGAVDQVLNLLC